MRGLALGVLVAGLLAAALWLVRGWERDTPASGTAVTSTEPVSGVDAAAEVLPAAALVAETAAPPATAPSVVPEAGSSVGEREEPARENEPKGVLRGRLVTLEDGLPLAAELSITLASSDNRVAETLRSDAEGAFTTARAFPRGRVRAFVRVPESGALLVRHEWKFDPRSTEEWLVPVPELLEPDAPPETDPKRTLLRGRVVTRDGRSVEFATVTLIANAGATGLVHAQTGPHGKFLMSDLAPGRYRVLAHGVFASSEPRELELAPGENRIEPLVLPMARSSGPIRGRVRSAAEDVDFRWSEHSYRDPLGIVRLSTPTGHSLSVPVHRSFEISGLPPGKYELTFESHDGREYEPSSLWVSPPADGVEFWTDQSLRHVHALRLRAAGTEAKPLEVVMCGRVGGSWESWWERKELAYFPPANERWVVFSPTLRPRTGDFTHGEPFVDERGRALRIQDVELEPGHGQALLFQDAASPSRFWREFVGDPVSGVEVLAEGRVVATSDADGLALVDLERDPGPLTFRKPGWRVAGDESDRGLRRVQLVEE